VLLQGKNAVIYGAGGPIGGAVALGFAREGATLHLTGRRAEPLERLAAEIRGNGGAATTATLDALDELAVDDHAAGLVASTGSLDISLNVISHGELFGTPLAETTLEDYERPIRTATRSTFITARAAARHMIKQRSGVILTFGGYGQPQRDSYLGGFQPSPLPTTQPRSPPPRSTSPAAPRSTDRDESVVVDSAVNRRMNGWTYLGALAAGQLSLPLLMRRGSISPTMAHRPFHLDRNVSELRSPCERAASRWKRPDGRSGTSTRAEQGRRPTCRAARPADRSRTLHVRSPGPRHRSRRPAAALADFLAN
jgi:NAD(P)-dependent dehydrogenase (short-subunit alcohol dehydrogenase family)